MSAKDFYTAIVYDTCPHHEKLDLAFERLSKALVSEANGQDPNGRLIVGMISLACKSEAEAFVA